MFTAQDVARFWSKVDEDVDCWTWAAAASSNGYGAFWIKGRLIGAHVFSWMLANGRVPAPGLVIHHKCWNRLCVRPEHIEETTQKVNAANKIPGTVNGQSKKTHCPEGHEYDRLRPNGSRSCKRCEAARTRAYRARRRAAQAA